MMVDSDAPPRIDWRDLAVAQLLHDVNNQLTLILGCAANLADALPPGRAATEIAQLRTCSERAAQAVRQLLTHGRHPLAPRTPIDVNDVLAPLGELLRRVAGPQKFVRVRLSPEPVPVRARIPELERIVVNLALNALDSLPGTGVVSLEVAIVGPAVRLTVSDTGSGMDADMRARVFEPFFTTKATGSGLGMASVAFTVRELQGTVTADSALGQGTTVTVTLPLASPRL